MFELTGPIKNTIAIPNDTNEDSRYFSKNELKEAVEYYKENGYVVLRSVIPESFCDQVDHEYQQSVKSYEGFIYRQTGGNPERHRLNDRGFLMNPILNIQDLPKSRLGEFSGASLKVITHENVLKFFEELYGEKPKVVQTMFFEGNSETWAHQDTYYLDSEKIGEMAAAWFAVEDIRPGAGRFFIYPGTHKLDMEKNEGKINVGFNHKNYIEMVRNTLKEKNLEVRAPALSKGDVLIWNSKTIHGSLETRQPEYSRKSLTAHYIPSSRRFLQFQSKIKPLSIFEFNGIQVNSPKNPDKLKQKLIFFVETRFPKTFQFVKWSAVRFFVTR